MNRKAIWGIMLIAVAGLVFANSNVSHLAETSPLEPIGVSINK